MPLHSTSVWKEPGTTQIQISVCINIPSGVGLNDVIIRVVEGSRVHQVTVQWPHPMYYLAILHRQWLSGSG